jgi:hypothetical protein
MLEMGVMRLAVGSEPEKQAEGRDKYIITTSMLCTIVINTIKATKLRLNAGAERVVHMRNKIMHTKV